MLTVFSVYFWRDLIERALKTAAQSLSATLVLGTGLLNVDWVSSVEIAATATVLSVLSSLASASFGQLGTASLVSSPTAPFVADPASTPPTNPPAEHPEG